MEVSAKIKELEEEFKVLKAEVRNVLVDIREVILDRSNPLGEPAESAHLTLDLNTTARAIATEAAAHEAVKLAEDGNSEHGVAVADEVDPGLGGQPHGAITDQDDVPSPAIDEDFPEQESVEAPKVFRRAPADGRTGVLNDAALDAPNQQTAPAPSLASTEIPPMYMAGLPPLSGNGSLAAWVSESMAIVGPYELERIIAIHRLWGNLPPNISRALAHLQELLQETEGTSPPWLRVMQDLDRLASL